MIPSRSMICLTVAIAMTLAPVADGGGGKKGKGRLLETTVTPLTIDKDRRLIVGGKEPMKIGLPAPAEAPAGGILLGVVDASVQPAKTYYIAYPTDPKAPLATILRETPGPGCSWSMERESGKFLSSYRDTQYFVVSEGPFKGAELRHHEGVATLVTRQQARTSDKYRLIGRFLDYDDLDDGP